MASQKVEYMLDNDEEMGRLEQQHPVLKDAIGGKLLLPPIDVSHPGSRILDSGTADGLWIRDLQTTLGANHEYVGTDVNPGVFPKTSPENTTYVVQDINAPWPAAWEGTFDLVHQRLTLAAAGPAMKNAVAQLCRLVRPGGWIQLIEAEQIHAEDDGPAMRQFITLVTDLFKAIGAGATYAAHLGVWVKEEGFVDVHEQLFDMYLGAKNTDKKLGEQGAVSSAIATEGLLQFVKSMPPGTTSISAEDMGTLVPRLKAELLEHGGYYPMRAVWGRKPSP